MAGLFQPGVAEGVEGLVLGCDGGFASPAVELVKGGRGVAASRLQGGDAVLHGHLDSITGLVLKELHTVLRLRPVQIVNRFTRRLPRTPRFPKPAARERAGYWVESVAYEPAPLMALAMPLLDTGVSIARRFPRKQPIFTGDAEHIHHRLREGTDWCVHKGPTYLSPGRLWGGGGAVAAEQRGAGPVQGCYPDRVLRGGMDWGAAPGVRGVRGGGADGGGGAFRRHLNDQIALQAFEEEMAAAETLDGARFEEKLVETNGNPAWRVEIPLEGEGHLVLTRCFGEEQAPTVLAPFAEAVRRGLGVRPTSTAAVAQPRPNGSERRSAAAGA